MRFHPLMNKHASVHLLILFIFASTPILVSPKTTPSHNFPTAKPTCVDRCGNISIPYPSGTTEECYRDPSFWVTCNQTFDPPKLFWQNSSTEIRDLSLDGQAKLLHFIGRDCYDHNGSRVRYNHPRMTLPPYFRVNNSANRFTMVGCDAIGYVWGSRHNGRQFRTGCAAMCEAEDDLKLGTCMGLGCCKTAIPKDVWSVEVELQSISKYSVDRKFNNCSYAFVVEKNAFRFSPLNLTSLMNVDRLPLVVDWFIGNGTCGEAKMNSTTYACVSPNSVCYNPVRGYGYRCRCIDGYQGNPYLINGCQDINECEDSTVNDCTKNEYCTNTPGSYTCLCPEGYSGDGRGPHGCATKQDMKIAFVLIGIAFGIITLLLVAILLYFELKRRRSKRMKQKFFNQNGGGLLQEKLTRRKNSQEMMRIFSSFELQKATNDFHNSMIIGQGGFGTVYKGYLLDNRTVAIKRSKKVDPDQIEQFINEVLVLSQVNHRNVVRLLGCCLETEVPLLVYEFISNGTLSSHIHNQVKARSLNWNTRLKIAVETADVLSYLHSAASTPIIHRDVKSDNILLDHNFTAKVSDFGASKLVPRDLSQLSTMVQGTFGYLDPEYMQTNKFTEKSDVYSFGVVLLELLTSRKAICFDKPKKEQILANFFLHMLKQERLIEILDVNIAGNGNMEHIAEVAKLAQRCLNVKGEDRPNMKEVATELEGLMLGRTYSQVRSVDITEEIQYLVGDNVELSRSTNGEGNSSSVGYDSLGYDSLKLSGGR